MTESEQPQRVDPRVTRTREKVLEAVRAILERDGPTAVTYSAVAAAAGVGRQTLYNHWPTPHDMVIDAAADQEVGRFPNTADSAEDAIDRWLRQLATDLPEHGHQARLGGLVAFAVHSPPSESALRAMVTSQLAAFNDLLAPLGLRCTAETYARIVGPLHFQVLVARATVSEALIDAIAASMAGELDGA